MIIVPTYNEKGNINKLVSKIRGILPNEKIFFIDDSSPDGTASKIKELQKSDSNIFLLERPTKSGIGSAYLNAFKEHLNSGEKYFITMDADLSHDPKYLKSMVSELENNDVVVGSRYTEGGGVSNWNFWRVVLSKFGNLYAKIFSSSHIRDLTSGYVGYNIEALKKIDLKKIKSDGYAFQIEIKKALEKSEATIKEIPITFIERENGKSKLSWLITLEGLVYPLKNFVVNHFPEILLFFGTFTLYALTAPRSIYFGDNAEFITAVTSMGIPHPSGYPAYILLAKLFSLLHLGNSVLATNLFSAFCASLGISIFYSIAKNYTQNIFAVISSALLAISPIFWSQAIIAEVYASNFLFLMLLVKIVFSFWNHPTNSKVYWFAFLLGLSLANHQMMVLLVPALISPLFIRNFWTKKTAIYSVLFLILGLSAYLYLPIRSAMHPILDWGHTSGSIKDFLHHVLRSDYQDLSAESDPGSKIKFASSSFLNVYQQFTFALILIVPGIYLLLREQKKILGFTAAILFLNILGIIFLRNIVYSEENVFFQQVYFIPAYAIVAFWIGVGLEKITDFITEQRVAVAASAAIGIIAVLWVAPLSFAQNNLRSFRFLEDYSREYLLSLKPNAVLGISFEGLGEDSFIFSLMYQKEIKHLRPDVEIVTYKNIIPNQFENQTEDIFRDRNIITQRKKLTEFLLINYPDKPKYVTYLVPGCQENGFACELQNSDFVEISSLNISADDLKISSSDYSGSDLLANYYLHQAAYYLGKDTAKAYDLLIKSIARDNQIQGNDMAAFANYRSAK